VPWPLILKGMLTFRDPKFYLFLTSTANGRPAAKAFRSGCKNARRIAGTHEPLAWHT
jgi:hypothetical protein